MSVPSTTIKRNFFRNISEFRAFGAGLRNCKKAFGFVPKAFFVQKAEKFFACLNFQTGFLACSRRLLPLLLLPIPWIQHRFLRRRDRP